MYQNINLIGGLDDALVGGLVLISCFIFGTIAIIVALIAGGK